MNIGHHFRSAQLELEEARENSKRSPQKEMIVMTSIPEYVGIQQRNNDLGDLLTQFNEVNHQLAEKMEFDR